MNPQLVGILVQAGATFGPQLVADVAHLIHGNPKAQQETDEAYAVRLGALTDVALDAAAAGDAKLEASGV